MKHVGGKPAELQDDFRRLHYCGVCKAMGTAYGQSARMMLNHDTVFLAELLSAISDAPGECGQWERSLQSINCLRMPKSEEKLPTALRFAADVNVLLGCIKIQDNRQDGSRLWGLADKWYAKFGEKARQNLTLWGVETSQIEEWLTKQNELEARSAALGDSPAESLGIYSEPTSRITAMIFEAGAFAVNQHLKAAEMSQLGAAFGKLVFQVDAWEDFGKDGLTGNFNAIRSSFGEEKSAALPQLHIHADAFLASLGKLGLSEDVIGFFVQRLEKHIPEWEPNRMAVGQSCSTATKRKIPWKMRGKMLRSLDRQWLAPGFGKNTNILKSALGFGAAAGVVMLAPSMLESFSRLFADANADWGNALTQAGHDGGYFQLRGNCDCCDNGNCNCCRNCNCDDDCDDTCQAIVVLIFVLFGLVVVGLVVGLVFLIRALSRPKAVATQPAGQGTPTRFTFREIRDYPGNSMADLTAAIQGWLSDKEPLSGPEITRDEPDRKVISSSFRIPFSATKNNQKVELGSVVYELHVHVVDDKAAFVFEEFHHHAGGNVPSGGSLNMPYPAQQSKTMNQDTWNTIKSLTQQKIGEFIRDIPIF